jgi:hypothetical protein
MRDVGQRLLIGLAGAAAVVMAIGYAFIAGRIATPLGADLGTFELPTAPDVAAVLLDDGRPAFIVAEGADARVLDARAPTQPGAPGRLVKWCMGGDEGFFLDLVDGAAYAATGELIGGEGTRGLVVYPTSTDGLRITVQPQGTPAVVAPEADPRAERDCSTLELVGHGPADGEVFDPSVAVDQEPPGWVYLEGTLVADDDEVALCDGLEGRCASGARVTGIDPALVPVGDRRLAGSFLGRVRDDAIVDLQHVPNHGGGRR